MNNTELSETNLLKLLTRQMTAGELHCCIRTVDHYIQLGLLPTVRLGRRRLIRQQDLEKFVSSLTASEARTK